MTKYPVKIIANGELQYVQVLSPEDINKITKFAEKLGKNLAGEPDGLALL